MAENVVGEKNQEMNEPGDLNSISLSYSVGIAPDQNIIGNNLFRLFGLFHNSTTISTKMFIHFKIPSGFHCAHGILS